MEQGRYDGGLEPWLTHEPLAIALHPKMDSQLLALQCSSTLVIVCSPLPSLGTTSDKGGTEVMDKQNMFCLNL